MELRKSDFGFKSKIDVILFKRGTALGKDSEIQSQPSTESIQISDQMRQGVWFITDS